MLDRPPRNTLKGDRQQSALGAMFPHRRAEMHLPAPRPDAPFFTQLVRTRRFCSVGRAPRRHDRTCGGLTTPFVRPSGVSGRWFRRSTLPWAGPEPGPAHLKPTSAVAPLPASIGFNRAERKRRRVQRLVHPWFVSSPSSRSSRGSGIERRIEHFRACFAPSPGRASFALRPTAARRERREWLFSAAAASTFLRRSVRTER